MTETNVTQLLAQMRAMAEAAQGASAPAKGSDGSEFAAMLKASMAKVNEAQQSAAAMKAAVEQGQPGVELAEVMVAVQKASVSFQAMVQVRNRLVSAYQDIMNMPI